MTDDCVYAEYTNYLFFMGFAPLSFLAWLLIGLVYLSDTKLSIPPGKLISAEAFSYMLNLISTIAYWPPCAG
jgi:hypothetical protein